MRIAKVSMGFIEVPNNISVLLYAQGCNHHCKDCHNEELWSFDGGVFYTDNDIRDLLSKYRGICTWVCWLGGDALFQPNRFKDINNICKEFDFKICLYTGFLFADIDNELLKDIDMIVDGKWDSTLGGVESTTTNQKTYKLINDEFKEIKFSEFNK